MHAAVNECFEYEFIMMIMLKLKLKQIFFSNVKFIVTCIQNIIYNVMCACVYNHAHRISGVLQGCAIAGPLRDPAAGAPSGARSHESTAYMYSPR